MLKYWNSTSNNNDHNSIMAGDRIEPFFFHISVEESLILFNLDIKLSVNFNKFTIDSSDEFNISLSNKVV